MIPIYIASSEKFACCETAIIRSIEENTKSDVDIKIIRPSYIGMRPTGCTGFTNVRFSIPHLLLRDGYDYGIYFDVDMIILGDVAELYEYKRPGKFVCLKDGSTEVAVISAATPVPTINEIAYTNKNALIQRIPRANKIPLSWNVEDRYTPEAKLIHFTDLKRQPWFEENQPHPCQQACEIWERYANVM